jgi:WD40 repeat protein
VLDEGCRTFYQAQNTPLGTVAVTPDGTLAATGSDGMVELWKTGDPARATTLSAGPGTIGQVAFSPGPHGHAGENRAGPDPAGPRPRLQPRRHHPRRRRAGLGHPPVERPGPAPGGSPAGNPQTLSANGLQLTVNRVAFAGRGSILVSATSDGSAHVWDLSPASTVRDLCTILGPSADAARWQHHALGPGHDPCPPA